MFSSLSVRDFRVYWLGMFISFVGTWIQTVSQSWLVFELTRSPFLLGIISFLGLIPVFLLSLFAGVLADRRNKRKILIVTQVSFMLLAFILGALTQFKLIKAYQIASIALLNGIIMAFDAPTRQSMVVELVGRDKLANAIALNSVAFNSSRFIGPAIAGILVAVIGLWGCFYINAVSFLAAIIALCIIKTKHNTRLSKSASVFKDLKEGVVFIRNNRSILILVSCVGMVSLFGASYVILMPVFADNVLGVGAKGMGLLISCAGFGALIGALALAKFADFKYKGKLLVFSALAFSIALILLSLSQTFLVSALFLFFIGASSVIATSLINTILQIRVPDEFRGRVMSVFMLTFAGLMPFGNLIAGILAQSANVSAAIFISGVICLVFFIIIRLFYPKINEL